MTMVWGDPAGFAVDWDWQRSLTVPAGWRGAGGGPPTPLVLDTGAHRGAQRGHRERPAACLVIPEPGRAGNLQPRRGRLAA